MNEHLESSKRSLRRLDQGYTEADWALVDAMKAVAEATVALAEEQQRANRIAFLTSLPWADQRSVPNAAGEKRSDIIAKIGADLFPDE
jgi:hypothetical protein